MPSKSSLVMYSLGILGNCLLMMHLKSTSLRKASREWSFAARQKDTGIALGALFLTGTGLLCFLAMNSSMFMLLSGRASLCIKSNNMTANDHLHSFAVSVKIYASV